MKLAIVLNLNGTSVPAEIELDTDALAQIADQVAPHPWPEWMNVQTAARYLDTTVNRVWHLKRAGRVPYVQDEPNGRVCFERAALDESFRARTATVPSPSSHADPVQVSVAYAPEEAPDDGSHGDGEHEA